MIYQALQVWDMDIDIISEWKDMLTCLKITAIGTVLQEQQRCKLLWHSDLLGLKQICWCITLSKYLL